MVSIGTWCNGSTAGSGPVDSSSNLDVPASAASVTQVEEYLPFKQEAAGSWPVGGTKSPLQALLVDLGDKFQPAQGGLVETGTNRRGSGIAQDRSMVRSRGSVAGGAQYSDAHTFSGLKTGRMGKAAWLAQANPAHRCTGLSGCARLEAHCLRVAGSGSPHLPAPGMQEWWDGIHTWLRTTRLKACRFESCLLD